MRFATLGLAALLLGSDAVLPGSDPTTQDQPGRAPLMIEIAARGYLEGGRTGSLAGDSASDRIESYVWADQTLCGMGAGDQAPRATPWMGWHFTGNVTSRNADELVVDVHWQRMWEAGRRVSNASSQTRTLRIRMGERVELDRIAPATVGRCGTLEARLEAAVMARAAYLMGVPGGVAAGVRPGVIGGVGAGRGGRGGVAGGVAGGAIAGAPGIVGGATAGVPGGVAAGAATPGRGGRSSRGINDPQSAATAAAQGTRAGRGGGVQGGVAQGAAAAAPQGARGGGRASVTGSMSSEGGRPQSTTMNVGRGQILSQIYGQRYEAEVWLVHKKPNGDEVVQQQTVRFSAANSSFAFPPVEVSGSGGPITIDISGSLQMLGAAGQRYGLTTAYLLRGGFAGRGGGAASGSGTGAGAGRGAGGLAAGRTKSESTDTATSASTPLFGVSIARRARRGNPFIDTRGTTDMSIQTPKPDDVLSFELPPLQKSTEDLLKGHTFSIRLRVTPIK